MVAQLRRAPLPVSNVEDLTSDSLSESLGLKAKEVLGYGLLVERAPDIAEMKKKAVDSSTLAQALSEIGKEPFVRETVVAYKLEEQKRQNRKSLFALPLYIQLYALFDRAWKRVLPVNPSDFLSALIMIISAGIAMSSITAFSDHEWMYGILLSPGILAAFSVLYIMVINNVRSKVTVQEWEWKRLTFAECYKRKIEIPQFALSTAVQVKEKLPNAQLFVEVLTSKNRQLADPFLVAVYGEEVHLEVWEESRFERMTTRKVS